MESYRYQRFEFAAGVRTSTAYSAGKGNRRFIGPGRLPTGSSAPELSSRQGAQETVPTCTAGAACLPDTAPLGPVRDLLRDGSRQHLGRRRRGVLRIGALVLVRRR